MKATLVLLVPLLSWLPVAAAADVPTPTDTPTQADTPTETPTATNSATPTNSPTVTALAVQHDAVVLPVAPIKMSIAKNKGRAARVMRARRRVKVEVRNADPASEELGDPIKLEAESVDCPAGVIVGPPHFLASAVAAGTITIPSGKTRTAVVPVTVHSTDFRTFNHKAPNRCTLRFIASTQVTGNSDPTPDNNVVTAELNVVDRNDPESASTQQVHETVLKSIKPLRVRAARDAGSPMIEVVHPVVVNADIRPAPDAADVITVSVDPISCDWISDQETLDMDRETPDDQDAVTLSGGKVAKGTLRLQMLLAVATTPNPKSPARCTVVLRATGPSAPDPEPSNNQTTLTIDIVDHTDQSQFP